MVSRPRRAGLKVGLWAEVELTVVWLVQLVQLVRRNSTATSNLLTPQQQLAEWREWCWATWGPGRELLWSITATPDAAWAWDTEHGNRRIYLKTDA